MARLQRLIVRANSVPLTNQLGDGQVADGAMLLNGVVSALYSKSLWTDLKTGLAGAFAGNGTVLVELANLLLERSPNGTYANLADADTSISCRTGPGRGRWRRGRRRPRPPRGRPRCSVRPSCGAA